MKGDSQCQVSLLLFVQNILNVKDRKGTNFADYKKFAEEKYISDWKVTTGHHNAYWLGCKKAE